MTPQSEAAANAAIVKWIREALEQGAVIGAINPASPTVGVRNGFAFIENLHIQYRPKGYLDAEEVPA